MAKPNDITYFTKKLHDQGKSASRKFDQATYAAMHKSLDESIGRIVAKLQALGELENTVFYSPATTAATTTRFAEACAV